MSFELSFVFYLAEKKCRFTDIVHSFVASGWALHTPAGFISYSISDAEDAKWNSAPIANVDQVMAALGDNELAGQAFSIILFDTRHGGTAHFMARPEDSSFVIDIQSGRRVCLDTEPYSDLNWYIARVIQSLPSQDCTVEAIRCDQHR